MCKNADNPCPGCGKHKAADAARMFFPDAERLTTEPAGKTPTATETPS